MSNEPISEVEFEDDTEDQEVVEHLSNNGTVAVVSGTDWTTETVMKQLERGNIQLNPGFQRRDAWKQDRKSRFIESLIVGLPIPQIVLAESKKEKGKFIVLDGKQRLLSILQFWGQGEGLNNLYALSGLELRKDLVGTSFEELSTQASFREDFDALCNSTIRTVVIKNWVDDAFLHVVFRRLNTGSVKLSPQELRQALHPGKFSVYVDEASGSLDGMRKLLGLSEPDPRMRDIEILARFLAFRFFAESYPGRMKKFLDGAFEEFNKNWSEYEVGIRDAVSDFDAGVKDLIRVFGNDVARKPNSHQFNRAIFDALIYYQSQPDVRKKLKGKEKPILEYYRRLFAPRTGFLQAVERDTAAAHNTSKRLGLWAQYLSKVAGHEIHSPRIPVPSDPKAPEPNAHARKKRSA